MEQTIDRFMQNSKLRVWKCEGGVKHTATAVCLGKWNQAWQRFKCVWCGVKSSSEWVSTEQPVRHNTGHQQSLPHTGYQHGTALGTRSVLQETSSNSASGQSERGCMGSMWLGWLTWVCNDNECLAQCGLTRLSPASRSTVPTSFWSSWREDLIRSRRAVSCFFSSSWVCLICGEKMQGSGHTKKAFIALIKIPYWQKNKKTTLHYITTIYKCYFQLLSLKYIPHPMIPFLNLVCAHVKILKLKQFPWFWKHSLTFSNICE